MKLGLFTLVILVGFVQLINAGPIRLFKRAAFYIANETACVVDNTVYFNGEPIPTDDPCEACKCRPPGFACVLKECEVKPGCRAVRRAGYCCPEYICGCEHNGRMYRDGDEIKDSLNPCFVCHCQGSSIACSFVDCFFRVDCAPEYVSGECCPHYNNCISTSPENQDPFSHGDNDNAQSSSEQPLPVATLLTILTEGSTSAEETFSPDITESSELPDEGNKDETDPSLILATNEEAEMQENVEKSEETYTTQDTERGSSYPENDATDLEKDISMEEPVNNISLNSGMDLSVEESKEEAKEEEITTSVDETNPEVVALSTEESKAVEVATTSETSSPITELEEMSEGSTEKLDEITTLQAMDATILPEEKRKSMKFHEDEETASDIVSKENPESMTKDQSKEQTSGTEASMTEEEILSGTKTQFFNDESSTEKSEASSETVKESTQMYVDMTGEAKDSTNGDVEAEKFIDEVVTIGEKKPKAEDNTEAVTLVVLVEDSDDQSVEKTDQPKEEEKSVMEADQPLEEAEHPIEEAALSVEEAEQPMEEAALSVEEAEQPIEEAALSVEEAELPVEKEEQPTEALDSSEERVGQPTNNVPVISSAEAGPEDRYKALDEAILSAFIPDDSASADESLDEKMNLSTEKSEIIEKEDALDQTEPLTIFLIESTKLPEVEEMTSMNVGGKSDTDEKPTEDIERAEENES